MNLLSIITLLSVAATIPDSPDSYRADTVYVVHDMHYPLTVIDEFVDSIEEYPTADIYNQPFDSLVMAVQMQNSKVAFERFFDDFINIEDMPYQSSQVPDSVYEARLKMILSPIQMPYNDVVKKYIIAYTTNRKGLMENVLNRSQLFFPMIEEELDRAGLPIELRILPVIESALIPTAVSRAGATGLWQFMYPTGKHYGLEVNSFVDERMDPILSTQAACRYLKDLYRIYGDWSLALAAYNCGPGNVNKAIKRSNGDVNNFWDIYPYLPKETRGYVPSFIAATYAYTFHYQHNITPSQAIKPVITDTVMIDRPLHFEQISSTIDVPVETIRTLNPQYKMDIIPASNKEYALTLPMGNISGFLENEEQIYAKDTVYLAEYLNPSAEIPAERIVAAQQSQTYKVKSGDTLSGIASKHNVTVAQLMKWNNLSNAHKLRVGQNLQIYR